MKFKSDKHFLNWYGYDFKPGEEVDIKEANLIRKARLLPFLNEVRTRKKNDKK